MATLQKPCGEPEEPNFVADLPGLAMPRSSFGPNGRVVGEVIAPLDQRGDALDRADAAVF